jgi:hypothetical protein
MKYAKECRYLVVLIFASRSSTRLKISGSGSGLCFFGLSNRQSILGNQTFMNIRVSYSLRSLLLAAIRAGRLPRPIHRRTFVTSVAHPQSWFLPGSCRRFCSRVCVSRIAIRIFMRFGPRLYQQLVKNQFWNWSHTDLEDISCSVCACK